MPRVYVGGRALDHDLPKALQWLLEPTARSTPWPWAVCRGGRDAVREVNKGHCVENLHFLGDGLWQAYV